MKTLVIADIHNHWETAEKIIKRVEHDQVVFLGDYFDDWGDTPPVAKRTAEWLKWSIEQPNRIHLIGNHDVPYINPSAKCGKYGWNPEKQNFVERVMTMKHWYQLQFHHWVDGWFLSHAGFHRFFYQTAVEDFDVEDFKVWIEEQEEGGKQALFAGAYHWFYSDAGYRVGNHTTLGGLCWLDFYNEFVPIPGLNQIMGHTPNHPYSHDELYYGYRGLPNNSSKNYCIDTQGKVSILIEDGNITLV